MKSSPISRRLSIAGPGRGEDLEVGVPRVEPHLRRRPVERDALETGVLRARLQAHAVPVALVDEAPVAVALAAQSLAVAGIAQPLARLLPAVGQHPLRQIPAIWPSPSRNGVVSASTSRPSTSRAAPSCRPRAATRPARRRCGGGRSGARSRRAYRPRGRSSGTPRSSPAGARRGCGRGSCSSRRTGRPPCSAARAPGGADGRVELEAGREPERARVHRLGDGPLHRAAAPPRSRRA